MKRDESKMQFYKKDEEEGKAKAILVTICCVTYNHEKYIRNALDGFINQKTNFMFEVVVHDDASTDHTADIIREYEKNYPKIIKPVFQKENQYSKGIRIFETFMMPRIRGKYIITCEGDDYWTDSDKLQKQVDILEGSNDYVACVHQTITLDMMTGEETLYSVLDKECDVDLETVVLQWGKVFQTASLIYRTEILEDVPEFLCCNKSGAGDYTKAIYLLLRGKVFYINEAMSVYRKNSGEQSWTYKMYQEEVLNERVKNLWREEITMFEEADKYSDFKYHKIFEVGIMRRNFALNGFQIAKGFWKDPYQKQLFKKRSLVGKCGIMLKLYAPKLYNRIYKIRHSEIKL